MAASTITLGSCWRALATAAGSWSQLDTRLTPIDEPPRAGLTNTGTPSNSRSSGCSSGRDGRSTACGPTGSPSATSSFLVNSLSMPAALASTPAPTYGTPASSSSPWIVPSSPYGPCSTGNTTSTDANTSPAPGGSDTSWPLRCGSAGRASSVPDSELTPGSCRLLIASASGLPSVSTHEPSGVMPTATTSKRCGSRLRRMLPADTHEMACSLLRPPNTTATRRRSRDGRGVGSLAYTTWRGYRLAAYQDG